jgi:restriction system protein
MAMARSSRSSPTEDVVALVAMLPWWLGLVLAPASYLLLHALATRPLAAPARSGDLGPMFEQALWQMFAGAGQYVVPFLCLTGAGVSAWRRRVRTRLVDRVACGDASDAVDGIGWREFELLVGEAFRLAGFRVVETGGSGADGGVDLVLSKPVKNGSERFLVQCKQWRARRVGVDVVRELYGVMAARGAAGGFVVTSGGFTDEAIAFASGRNVMLVDGPTLRDLLRRARTNPSAAPLHPTGPANGATAGAASCPACSKPMVRRTARRGPHAGRAFWGCSGYPGCRGTRSIG